MGATGAANFYSGNAGGNLRGLCERVAPANRQPRPEVREGGYLVGGFRLRRCGVFPITRGCAASRRSVDWWKVNINDAIQQYSPDYAGYLCYGTRIVTNAAEAAQQAATEACQKVPREPTRGTALSKLTAYDNQATIETSGIDVSLNWSAPLRGSGAGCAGSHRACRRRRRSSITSGRRRRRCRSTCRWNGKARSGPDLIGTNPGAYDYRLISSLSYSVNKLNVNLGWRYLPGVITAAKGVSECGHRQQRAGCRRTRRHAAQLHPIAGDQGEGV